MAPYAWSLNGEYWPNVNPLMIAAGQRVAINFDQRFLAGYSMDSTRKVELPALQEQGDTDGVA